MNDPKSAGSEADASVGAPSEDPGSPRAVALAAGVLLSLYMGLALGYGDAIPLFEAPDEPAHLHYAVFIHETWRMPDRRSAEVPGMSGEPPLVYAIAAPLVGAAGLDFEEADAALRAVGREIYYSDASLPEGPGIRLAGDDAHHFTGDGSLAGLRRLRAAPLAFGLLAVTFSFAAVWRVGRDARLALLASGLLAFNPQFLFASGSFSSDTGAAAIGAAALWIVLRALEEGGPSRNQYIAGAALLAIGCLTRLATLPGLIAAAGTLVAIDRRPVGERRLDLALAGAIVLVLAGPYALWSLDRGGVAPAGLPMTLADPIPGPAEVGSILAYLLDVYGITTFTTYWGTFGWLDLPAPDGVMLVLFTISWTGLLGYFTGRVSESNALLRDGALHAYLLASIGLTALAHLAVNLLAAPSDGRALFAVAPQIGLLLALGLGRLLGHGGRTLAMTIAVIAALVLIDVYCLRGVLIPAYF